MADAAARRGLHRGEPGAHRRGDDARRHRRGLPRLQRELRPAVRPDLRAQGRRPERGPAREGQRGARRRHARRRRRRDRPASTHERLGDRAARAQARDDRQAAAGRLDGARPPALRARPEVRRDHEGQLERGLRGRRRRSRCAAPRPSRSRSTRSSTSSTSRRARRRRSTSQEFGNALAGRGQDLNDAIGSSTRCCGSCSRSCATSPPERTQLSQLLPRRSAQTRGGGRAGGRGSRPTLFANLDTTFTALADVARPYIQESISGGPPALDAAIESLPPQRPFLANNDGAVPRAAAGRRARCSPPRRTSPTPSRSARPRCATRSPFNERLDPDVRGAAALRRRPAGDARRRRPDARRRSSPNPTLAHLAPAQTVCNYVSLWFRNVVVAAHRGRHQRHRRSASSSSSAPAGPNNEGGPASAPANGGVQARRTTTCTPTRTRTRRRPARRRSARPANETYPAGQQVIGNVPGNQGTTHDETTRDTTK